MADFQNNMNINAKYIIYQTQPSTCVSFVFFSAFAEQHKQKGK